MVAYNGIVVLELNGLSSYEEAVRLKGEAMRMPETLMAFLGASGRSVKIVCRGELFEGGLPEQQEDIERFHANLYNTARQAYQNQFHVDIEYLEPRLDRVVYMSADPEMYYNPQARLFLADVSRADRSEQGVSISEESDGLMPGRGATRT